MSASDAEPYGRVHGKHEGIDTYKERELGFWLYLSSDAVIFSLLFATYCTMVGNTAGGVTGSNVFELSTTLRETVALLASTFTFGLVTLSAARGELRLAIGWLGATFLLGGVFVVLELSEFLRLMAMGAGPAKSGFLSAFFTLVATHGLHVSAGLIWIAVMVAQILIKGLTAPVVSRLARLGLFWHFLDLVWIGIFSVVYLPGVL
jgi:cytochrome o ubiquinol oxidase subunit III